MSTILFRIPDFENPSGKQKRHAYPMILSDTLRAATDATAALKLFSKLLRGETYGPDSLGFMAFDAHGGDTGCHLRAGMLREIFSVHRRIVEDTVGSPAPVLIWIEEYIEKLESITERCQEACLKLTKERIHPTKLGFGAKQDCPHLLLGALGWTEPIIEYDWKDLSKLRVDGKIQPNNDFLAVSDEDLPHGRFAFSNFDASDHSCQSSVRGGNGSESPYPSPYLSTTSMPAGQSMTSLTLSTAPTSIKDVNSTTPSICGTNDEEWPLHTKWNIHDPKTFVRFVVYTYTLSKYKTFCRLDDVIGARLCPQAAAAYSSELIEPFWNTKNVEYKPAKPQRVETEFRALQSWLSDLSSAWLNAVAERSFFQLNLSRLLLDTVQRSAKGLTSMACYPGYLVLREEWARANCQMILVDRHFCQHGYHINLYLVTLSQPVATVTVYPTVLGQKIDWQISPSSIENLLSSPEQSTPHMVVMGNSIAGSYADYMRRIPTVNVGRPEGSRPHQDFLCSENVTHSRTFCATDHDRLALAFFAVHKAYAFPLPNNEDPEEFVGTRMDAFEGEYQEVPGPETLRMGWNKGKDEADEVGTGEGNLSVFGWQHMVLETKERIAGRLRIWQENENLMPLSAPVGNSKSM